MMGKLSLVVLLVFLTCSSTIRPTGSLDTDRGCTTVMAIGNSTRDGSTIIAKNRDLSEYEVQWLYHSPRKTHPETVLLKLQYIEIPQINLTWGWVGSKSYTKKWGVGMGINEWGVVVGDNDAPTREPLEGDNGLHDNDICRLILERSRTAYEGMRLTGELIEKYGHSYIGQIYCIADPNEIWIVECAGHHWAAVKLSDGIAIRANQYQITNEWEAGSVDLVEYAIDMDWCNSRADFNFAECYSKLGYPYKSSQTRLDRVEDLLKDENGDITKEDMMKILSDHYEGTNMYKGAHDNSMYRTICNIRTVSSMVAQLQPSTPSEKQVMWFCMMSPCISLYTPVFSNVSRIPDPYVTGSGPETLSGFDPNSAWWVFKRLQLKTDENYDILQPAMREKWDALYNKSVEDLQEILDRVLDLHPYNNLEARKLMDNFTETKLMEAYSEASHIIKDKHETVNKINEETGSEIILYGILIASTSVIIIVLYLYVKRE